MCVCYSHSCVCISPGQNLELQQCLFGSSALLVLLQLSAQGLHGILNEGQQGWDVRSHQQHPLGHCVVLHCNGTHSSGSDGMHPLHNASKKFPRYCLWNCSNIAFETVSVLPLKQFHCCPWNSSNVASETVPMWPLKQFQCGLWNSSNVAFDIVPMLVKLTTALSCLFKEGHWALPSSMPGDRWCDVLGFAPADVSSSSTFTSFEDLPMGRQRFISLGAGQPDFKFVTFPITEI